MQLSISTDQMSITVLNSLKTEKLYIRMTFDILKFILLIISFQIIKSR